jgi:Tfp pilus assembly protein PilV
LLERRGMKSSASGLTLIEVTLCLALLTVGLLATAETILMGHRLTRESTERAHARKVAEARLTELRALLHRASWTDPSLNAGDAQAAHDAQFQLLVEQHATSVEVDLLDDAAETARIPATVTTYVYAADEALLGEPPGDGEEGGLGLVDVDLDADGDVDQAATFEDLLLVGVKVEVTWRSAARTETLRFPALLY